MPIPLVDLARLLTAPGPTTALGSSTFPLALFPVRLETRYFFDANHVAELRIRVYPDKIHLDAHDPALTAAEAAAGRRYWRALWPVGTDDPAALRAWQVLAGQFGPRRAAWIQRRLTPTNQADRPGGEPRFPDPGPPATSPRTPRVRLLPDRWVATAFANGGLAGSVTGRPIVANLAVGPELAAPVTIDDERPAIDDGMRWMIDFAAAEQAGMGLRMTVPGNGNVDLLLVTGVSLRDRSADVAAQLDAHHYTDGLEFLDPGTPTNNTAAGRSPLREADPTHELSFAREVRPAATEARSYAELMRRAFGVDVFGHIGGAHHSEETPAAAMATALWPATWGYFLSTMVGLGQNGPSLPTMDAVRRHVLAFVRPGGPLPVLRAGAQPYGVLPVTSLDTWQISNNDSSGTAVRSLLVAARNVSWRPAAAGRTARVGNTDDPNTDLADVLQTAPGSTSFAVRGVMGAHFLEHLRAMLSTNPQPPNYAARLFELTSAMTQPLSLASSVLTRLTYEETAHRVRTPLVGVPSYIAELLAATDLDALALPVPATADPLLKALLRHALLRVYAEAAARLLNQRALSTEDLLREAELVDLVPGTAPTQTWRRQRDAMVPGTTVTVRERLRQAPGPLVSEVRSAFSVLAQTDAATLERHLAGTLDATSHRLDAWVTSLATRRLAEQRLSQPSGLSIGGYAWLENLRPAPTRPVVEPVPGEPGPLSATATQPGFIHAPSLNQASAAALLRNAHLAHGGTPDSPYAIDLSSGRIRLVRQLFEGVRQGQPLGALLGYTLERRLHEGQLDDLIDPLRALAPLPGASTPTGVRRIAVDGLALSALWRSDRDSVLASLPPTDTRRPRAARILDALDAAVDAASDAVQAEAAFQMVRGNVSRTASSLDGISTGESPPPDLGFLKTPRTGVGVTHRVAMVLPATTAGPGPGWASNTPRALADPVLNAWAGRLLGPANALSARVEELDATGEVTLTRLVAFPALGLAPIDLVWMTAGADGVPPELVARVLAAGPAATTARLRVDLGRSGTGRSVGDLVEVATRMRQLLAGARSLDGGDLLAPHAEPVRGLDLDEYEARAVAAQQALAAVRAALSGAIASGNNLRRVMLDVAAFGVAGALPTSDGPLTAQANALLVELDRRLGVVAPPAAADEVTRRDQILTRFQTVFGSGFLSLPRFTASNASDVAASLADGAALRAGDPLAAHTWLLRMERVRAALTRLGRPLREAEVLGTGARLNPSIAQVPHVPGQRWLGLPLVAGATPVDGKLSLVLQDAPSTLVGRLCGILVDEWTELIPSPSETTGIAFQYDPPDSVAPQAILLAVPPVLGRGWTVDLLNRVLIETLELGRLRLVGPGALGDIRHFVPAAFLAFNLDADTVSTDLVPLTT